MPWFRIPCTLDTQLVGYLPAQADTAKPQHTANAMHHYYCHRNKAGITKSRSTSSDQAAFWSKVSNCLTLPSYDRHLASHTLLLLFQLLLALGIKSSTENLHESGAHRSCFQFS